MLLAGATNNLNDLLNQKVNDWINEIPKRKKVKLTKLQKAQQRLSNLAIELDAKVTWYAKRIDIAHVIAELGGINPIYRGRPSAFAMKLLEGVPAPVGGKLFRLQLCGLMYYTPPIYGKRRSENRTSMAGLALLKHWAGCREDFARYHAAFVTEKATREITSQCIDLYLGIVPNAFTGSNEANKAFQKRTVYRRDFMPTEMVNVPNSSMMPMRPTAHSHTLTDAMQANHQHAPINQSAMQSAYNSYLNNIQNMNSQQLRNMQNALGNVLKSPPLTTKDWYGF